VGVKEKERELQGELSFHVRNSRRKGQNREENKTALKKEMGGRRD